VWNEFMICSFLFVCLCFNGSTVGAGVQALRLAVVGTLF
jgi:hypothetical protein